MAVDFPASLPAPSINFSHQEGQHWRRNDVQAGPPRYQLMTTNRPTIFSVEWFLNPLQLQIFEGWFKSQTVYGSVSFNIKLPVMGDPDWKNHECYFDAPYTVSAKSGGLRWGITASLLAIRKQYDDDCFAQNVAQIASMTCETDLCAFLDNFTATCETTLPDNLEPPIAYGTTITS